MPTPSRTRAHRSLFASCIATTLALVAPAASAQSYQNPVITVSVTRPQYNPGYVSTPVRVNVAPPAPLMDIARPAPPMPNAVWVPGSWSWNGSDYAWSTGQWNTPVSNGAIWVAARWERHDGYYLYYPGYWSQPGMPVDVTNAPGTPLVVGSTVSGVLNAGLPTTSSGTLYTDYVVNLYAGQTVTFVLRGGSSWTTPGGRLDPLLEVLGAGQLLAQDDDGAGGMDSRIVFTPQWTGAFVIRATTYGVGMNQGYFSLASRGGVVWGGI